jgi:phosphoribosylanthranilate isomerase
VGFVFYEPSPRYVTPEAAAALAEAIPPAIKKVAVLVDADDETIANITAQVPLDMVQLHGHEDPARVAEIRRHHGVAVMKSISVADAADVERAAAFEACADRLLFDAKAPPASATPGGNALSFDWSLLRGRSWGCPWGLSGGLGAANVAQAVGASGTLMVDVSSGVERSKGVKDDDLITGFLAAVAGIGA